MLSSINLSTMTNNTVIFDRGKSWNFKEALMIKKHRLSFNSGLKASKKL